MCPILYLHIEPIDFIAMDKQNDKEQEKVWICSICGYNHKGPEPPAKCPICAASKEYFDEVIV